MQIFRASGSSSVDIRAEIMNWFQPLRGVNAKFDVDVTDDGKLPDSVLDRLKSDGVNTIFMCTTLTAPSGTSSAVSVQYPVAKFQAIYNRVKAKGFKVGFKPHISGGGGTGGTYTPTDVPGFITNYQAILGQYMNGLTFDYVSVSNELQLITNGNLAAWSSLISWVRAQQPTAAVFCSSTLAEMATNVFYSQLDYIGLNAYMQLQKGAYPYANPTLQDLMNGWFMDGFNEQFIPTLQAINAQYGKKIIITEVGTTPVKESLQSTPLTYAVPPNTADEATQAMYYQAAFEILGSCEFVQGMSFWSITDGFSFLDNTKYPAITPRQAELVVKSFWGGFG